MDDTQYNEVIDNEIVTVDFSAESQKLRKTGFIARLIYSALSLLTGILFIVARDHVFNLLGYIAGALFFLTDAVAIVSFIVGKSGRRLPALIWGILQTAVVIFCLARPKTIADIAVYVFALLILIGGVVMIYFAVADKQIGFVRWKAILAFGIVLALLGAAMLLFVRQSQVVIAVITGISFVITAILHLIAVLLQ